MMKMNKIVIATDSYKGSLSAEKVCSVISDSARRCFPEAEIITCPIADGGEGTLDSIRSAKHLDIVHVNVTAPDFSRINAEYAVNGSTAYIEMAKASGLGLMKKPDARHSTSKGLGELICHALDLGMDELYIAIGGSATNDGGMGMLTALGVRFFDENGMELDGTGDNLIKISCIDKTMLHPGVQKAQINVICDVKNPLTGINGATMVYGRQKGASEEDLVYLESGMLHYASLIEKENPQYNRNLPGSGAAGGVGAALMSFLSARFLPGIDTVLDIVDFDALVKDADLIITGEGCTDAQSAFGKAVSGVGERSGNKLCIALSGSLGDGYETVYEHGIDAVYAVTQKPMPLTEAMENAPQMLKGASERLFRLIKAMLKPDL